MAYIGAQVENRISPAFIKEDFVGDGSSANFTLTNEVPGGSSQNVMVVLNNVVQEPDVAYTINDDSSNLPKILAFTGTPATGSNNIYVVHRSNSLSVTPPSGRDDDIANLQVTTSLSGENISGTLNTPFGLNGTDGSATDAGDNLVLNGTDATSANADSSVLFDDATGDPNFGFL